MQKLNWKLVITLVLCVAIAVGGAVFAHQRMTARRLAQYVQWGNDSLAQSRFEEAADHYSRALALTPGDSSIAVKLGDSLYQLSASKPECAAKAVTAWESALRSAPEDVDTTRKVFEYSLDAAQMAPTIDNFRRLQKAAAQLAKVAPSDSRANVYEHAALVEQWLAGLIKAGPDVDAEVDTLEAILQRAPGDDVALFCAGRARIRQAIDLRQGGASGLSQSAQKIAKAKLLVDRATNDPVTGAIGRYRASQVYVLLAQIPGVQPAAAASLMAQARAEADRATASITPESPLFVDLHLWAADVAARQFDTAAAEKIHRALLAGHAASREARLAYAEFLGADASRATEALSLLTAVPPATTDEQIVGPRALKSKMLEARQVLLLARLRVVAAISADDRDDTVKRSRLLDEAESACARATTFFGEHRAILSLIAQLQQARHRHVDAIHTLERASSLADRGGGNATDSEIDYLRAVSYEALQQPTQARSVLQSLLVKDKACMPAMLMLSRILIRDGALLEAEAHVAAAEAQQPKDPAVIRTRIALLQAAGKRESAQRLSEGLPEQNLVSRIEKAKVAASLENYSEAKRLLGVVRQEDPSNVAAAGLLARVHLNEGSAEAARTVLADALAKAPQDTRLKELQRQLEDVIARKPLDPMGTARETVSHVADEAERERQLGLLALEQDNLKEARGHLDRAASLRPDDLGIVDLLFVCDVRQRLWAAADARAAKLSAANQDQAGGLTYRIRIAAARNQLADALGLAVQLTDRLPQFAASWVLLGDSQQAALRFEEALGSYAKALTLSVSNVGAYKGLVACNYMLKRPEQAALAIAQAKRAVPRNREVESLDLQHRLNYEDVSSVVKACESALQEEPNRPENILSAGCANLRLAQTERVRAGNAAAAAPLARARELIARALEQRPDDQGGYIWSATAALEAGDVAGGEAALGRLADRPAWRERPEPYVLLADYFGRCNLPEKEAESLKAALTRSPDETVILTRLARLLAKGGRVDEALSALAPHENNPETLGLSVRIRIDAGRIKDAETLLKARLEKSPQSVPDLSFLAAVYQAAGQSDAAIDSATKALELDKNNVTALYERGVARLLASPPQLDGAEKDLTAARERNPVSAEIRLALAEAYRRGGKIQAGISELLPVANADPRDRAIRLALINLYSETAPPKLDAAIRLAAEAQASAELKTDPVWARLEGRLWMRAGDTGKGMDLLRKAVAIAPGNMDSQKALLEGLLAVKDPASAVAEADRFLAASPKASWCYLPRAVAKRRIGDMPSALADFDSALAAVRDDYPKAAAAIQLIADEVGVAEALQRIPSGTEADAGWQLVSAQLKWKQQQSLPTTVVDGILNRLDALRPSDRIAALRLAGYVYCTAQPAPEIDKAIDAYKRLLAMSPTDIESLNNLASLFVDSTVPSRPDDALLYSRRAFELTRRGGGFEPSVTDTYGWTLVKTGRSDEAVPLLRQCVQQLPLPETHYHLAEALLGSARPDEARKQVAAASALLTADEKKGRPSNAKLHSQLEALDRRAAEAVKKSGRTSQALSN